MPDEQPLRDTHAAATAATASCASGWSARPPTRSQPARPPAAATTQQDLDQAAADLALPTTLDALQAVRDAVGAYRAAVAGLWPEARGHADRLRSLAAAETELRQAETEERQRAEEAATTEREAHAAERRRDTPARASARPSRSCAPGWRRPRRKPPNSNASPGGSATKRLALAGRVGDGEGQTAAPRQACRRQRAAHPRRHRVPAVRRHRPARHGPDRVGPARPGDAVGAGPGRAAGTAGRAGPRRGRCRRPGVGAGPAGTRPSLQGAGRGAHPLRARGHRRPRRRPFRGRRGLPEPAPHPGPVGRAPRRRDRPPRAGAQRQGAGAARGAPRQRGRQPPSRS